MGSRPITFLWLWPATDHEPHCRHVPINKIWRRTESTPRSGWWCSRLAWISSYRSTREIIIILKSLWEDTSLQSPQQRRRSNGVGRAPPPSCRQKIQIIFLLQWKLGHPDIKHQKNVLSRHSQLRECTGVLCTWVKLLTDLQISGCELHKNAFGGRAPLGEL